MSALQCPTTLVMARHCEAEYDEDWFSDEGGSLTLPGRARAATLAEDLRGRRVAHVWCSDTSRAVQTAEIAAAVLGVGVRAVPALREIHIGHLIGQPFSLPTLTAVTDCWFAGDLDAGFDGGEDGHQVLERYTATLARIADAHPGETVLVIGHQMAASLAVQGISGTRGHPLLANGESAELVADADGWRLTRWGSSAID